MAVLDGLRGQNLMRTNLDGWRHRLLASPWIKDAALRRSLPSTVEVLVSERSPIALGRIDGKLYLIDERGLVIDQYGPQGRRRPANRGRPRGAALEPTAGARGARRGRRASSARSPRSRSSPRAFRRLTSPISTTLGVPHERNACLPERSAGEAVPQGRQPSAKLYYMVYVLMDHREGLAVDVELRNNGFAEREAALAMLDRHPSQQQRTVAADKAYDSADFIADCRKRSVTPHVAMNITETRDSGIDARTTRHAGYLVSQRVRKRIEECFGWGKDGRPMRKMKVVGLDKVSFLTTLTVSCYTLLRLAKLLVGPELVPA